MFGSIKQQARTLLCLAVLLMFCTASHAQFTFGTTGLLHLPTADMQRDKTFMGGGTLLNLHSTPSTWNYNTYNYYIGLTFFPWMEVTYTCTLFSAKSLGVDKYPYTKGHFSNQDRNFGLRLRLWKEGWWKTWTPQIVFGANDVLHTREKGSSLGQIGVTSTSNGYWGRFYIAATKHFDFQGIGNLGAHAVYFIDNNRTGFLYNGLGAGVNFQFATPGDNFGQKLLNRMNVMAEYDTREGSIGMHIAVWKDMFNIATELYGCKHLSVGAYMKIHLR